MERRDSELIGAKEAAAILKVDRTGVIRRVASGELSPIQKLPGTRGAYIFKRADVLALIPELTDAITQSEPPWSK